MEDDKSYLGPWLKAHIKRLGLTAEGLGNQVGVSRTSIYNYISDHDRPRTDTISKICAVFGVPLEEALKLYTQRAHTGSPKEYADYIRKR